MHHRRIVAIELLTMIDVVERVVETDCRLCREKSYQTYIAAFAQCFLRLFDQLVAQDAERVVMQFGIGIRFGKVDWVFRTAEMVVIAAIE